MYMRACPLSTGIATMEEVSDERLTQDDIEGWLSIQVEDKDWLSDGVQGMLDGLTEQDRSKFVAAPFTLELCRSLVLIPGFNVQVKCIL